DLYASRADEIADARFGLGSRLEVVVDDGCLAVEEEAGEAFVAFEQVEQAVDNVNELQSVRLEGRVPLAVPMRVGNDPDLPPLDVQGHRSTSPCAVSREFRNRRQTDDELLRAAMDASGARDDNPSRRNQEGRSHAWAFGCRRCAASRSRALRAWCWRGREAATP